MKKVILLPVVSLDTNLETATAKTQPRKIFGVTIPNNDRNEIKLTLEIIKEVAANNEGKQFTFNEFITLCKQKRVDPKFNLTAFNLLKPRVKTNFINRIAKTLGGTIISANYKESAQSKYFNFEIATGSRIKFAQTIDPTLPLSAQVKKDGQTFILPSNLTVKPKKLLVDLNKAQRKELDKFTGATATATETETEL